MGGRCKVWDRNNKVGIEQCGCKVNWRHLIGWYRQKYSFTKRKRLVISRDNGFKISLCLLYAAWLHTVLNLSLIHISLSSYLDYGNLWTISVYKCSVSLQFFIHVLKVSFHLTHFCKFLKNKGISLIINTLISIWNKNICWNYPQPPVKWLQKHSLAEINVLIGRIYCIWTISTIFQTWNTIRKSCDKLNYMYWKYFVLFSTCCCIQK